MVYSVIVHILTLLVKFLEIPMLLVMMHQVQFQMDLIPHTGILVKILLTV